MAFVKGHVQSKEIVSTFEAGCQSHLQKDNVPFLQKNLDVPYKIGIFASREPAKPLHDAQMCGSFFWGTFYKDILVAKQINRNLEV